MGIDLHFYEGNTKLETWCDYPCVPHIGEKIQLYDPKRKVTSIACVTDVLYFEHQYANIIITFNKFE